MKAEDISFRKTSAPVHRHISTKSSSCSSSPSSYPKTSSKTSVRASRRLLRHYKVGKRRRRTYNPTHSQKQRASAYSIEDFDLDLMDIKFIKESKKKVNVVKGVQKPNGEIPYIFCEHII